MGRLLAPPEGESASLADQAYYAIRELIVSLDFATGDPISERDLTDRLGIGRTPIREALRQLSQEKLVEVFPRRGMFVTTVEIRDLALLSEVRTMLESQAAAMAAERATELDRAALDALLEDLDDGAALDGRALIELDRRIHERIYRCTHNRFLEATVEEYYTLALRIWFLALDRAIELRDAVLEHRALLEAIRDGDATSAGEIMRSHVLGFEESMRRVLVGGA